MESELLKIFDEQGRVLGTAPRSEVHKRGHWHETFHCWFTERKADKSFLYFQIRSAVKKDYPDLLDITAAGHIMANETWLDGLREVKEELGIDLEMEELFSLGVIKDSLICPQFIDNEMCHVYVYNNLVPYEKYRLQKVEVSGIVRISLNDFEKLWFEGIKELQADGFTVNSDGEKDFMSIMVKKEDFVPHEDAYIKSIVEAIKSL